VVPPLTEERRRDLTKTSKSLGEDAKIGVRTIRKDSIESVKKLLKTGLPEDEAKDAETKIQTITDAVLRKLIRTFSKRKRRS